MTNRAFTPSALTSVALLLPVRFSWIPLAGETGPVVDVLSAVGIGVLLGLMTFGFLATVLFVISRAFLREYRELGRQGRHII